MSGLTVAEAQIQLDLWLAASRALATSKSYQIGTRQLTRANWKEVQDAISFFLNIIRNGGVSATGTSGTTTSTKPKSKTYRVLVRDL